MKKEILNPVLIVVLGGSLSMTGSLLAAPAANAASTSQSQAVLVADNTDATEVATPTPPPATTGPADTAPAPSGTSDIVAEALNPGSTTAPPVTETLTSDYYSPQAVAQGSSTNPLPVRFGLTLGLIADDNIYIRHSNKIGDFIEVITPSIIFETSKPEDNHPNFLSLTFDPNISFYDCTSTNNNVDFHVGAFGQRTFGQLVTTLAQDYDTSNGPNVDFGGRLFTETYTTRFTAAMPVTHKINWDLEIEQELTRYDQGYNNNQWKASSFFDYQIFPKTRLGLGAAGGIVDFVDGFQIANNGTLSPGDNTDQSYEQGLVRVIYDYSERLHVTSKIGAEVRQYDAGGSDVTPVVDTGIVWTPFVDTAINVNIYRQTVAAISLHNTDYDLTGISITGRQKVFQKFYGDLLLSYNNSDYKRVVPSVQDAGLVYNFYEFRPALEWHPNEHFAASVYYQFQKNASSIANTGFEDNQVGITGSVAY